MAARHILSSAIRSGAALASPSTSSTSLGRRALSTSLSRHAITNFAMPAMSPTMTQGGVAAWKVKEGQSFSAGDVLLEIETDKATMDVEAQDDGILAKIVVQDGAKDVQVGKIIAVLAEEGDDISNVQAPKEEEQSSSSSSGSESASSGQAAPSKAEEQGQEAKSSPNPSSGRAATTGDAAPGAGSSGHHHAFKGPMFPSVQRLIAENNIADAENKIKGTGIRGMITKGDVLAFLGKAKTPTGTFKEPQGGIAVLGPSQANPKKSAVGTAGGEAKKASEPLSGTELRSLIIGGLAASAAARRTRPAAPVVAAAESEPAPTPTPAKKVVTRKDGIRSDDPLWALL